MTNIVEMLWRAEAAAEDYDPEPRWPASIAVLAVGGLYTALPNQLTFGPYWLFPSLVLALLIPGVVSHHTGRHRLNALLGFAVEGLLTAGLIISVILLVGALPTHMETPLQLLVSAASLWITNFLLYGTGDSTLGGRTNGTSSQYIAMGPSSFRR